jgi:hypothetical protein
MEGRRPEHKLGGRGMTLQYRRGERKKNGVKLV